MKRVLIAATGWLLFAVLVFLPDPAAVHARTLIWAPPPLSSLIEEGLSQNREIKSLEEKVEGRKREVPFAGSLEDPRLGFAILNLPVDSFRFDQEAMTKKEVFIAQKFPWFGKLSLRSRRALLKAFRLQAALDTRRLELARQIAAASYDLGFTATALDINAKLTTTVTQLLQVAETRYATGSGLQQDVLQAQVEVSKLMDEKIRLKKQSRTLQDRIHELLNRQAFSPVSPLRRLDFPNLRLDVKALQATALKNNPRLRMRQVDVDIATVEIELARKDYWPDMDVKLAYGQREEDFNGRSLPDFVSGSVTINIPLWQRTRQDARLAAARKNHEGAVQFHSNLAESLPHRVDALATEIRDTQENYRLFKDALILQAEQWAASSLSAYEVGSLDFNTMIGAQIRLLRLELQAEKYLFDVYRKRAELEEVLGGALPAK